MHTPQQTRSTRFHLDLSVSFEGEDGTNAGHCINVSESGLLARCDQQPELWIEGHLLLEAGEHYLSIHARVARLQGNDVGFAFIVETDNDRAAIRILVDSASDRPLEE